MLRGVQPHQETRSSIPQPAGLGKLKILYSVLFHLLVFFFYYYFFPCISCKMHGFIYAYYLHSYCAESLCVCVQMLSCGIPELSDQEDLKYVYDALRPHESEADATMYFTRLENA